jgi:hypothetical protein
MIISAHIVTHLAVPVLLVHGNTESVEAGGFVASTFLTSFQHTSSNLIIFALSLSSNGWEQRGSLKNKL